MAYDEAETHYREALAIARRLGDLSSVQLGLTCLGIMAEARGRSSEAEPCFVEALTICPEISNHVGVQYARYLLLALRAAQGRAAEDEVLAAVVAAGETLGTAHSRMFAAQATLISEAMGDGATPDALSGALEAVRAARVAHGKQPDVEDGPATPLFLTARHLARRGFAVEAAALAREALAEVGDRLWPYRAEAEALGAA
jgi:hypothetical protein